jgi:hypothetical protein
LVDALLVRANLNPSDYLVRMQDIRQPAHWKGLNMLVTVSCGLARVSRTYPSGPGPLHWLTAFSEDVETGVFTPRSIVR